MFQRTLGTSSAIAAGAVALGAVFGFATLVLALRGANDLVLLLVAVAGPALSLRVLYRLHGAELVLMSILGTASALAFAVWGASGYST